MKKRKGLKIHLSNRLSYTLIAIGILIAVGIGVYAATYTASGAGHPYTEISTCGANQTLKMSSDGSAWSCGSDIAGITQEYADLHYITQSYADLNYKDPPGQWTCNLRASEGGTGTIKTASCVSPEKIITGGCRMNGGNGNYLFGYPSSNGWICECTGTAGICSSIRAYAYCCL
jgi:hypothetical protein